MILVFELLQINAIDQQFYALSDVIIILMNTIQQAIIQSLIKLLTPQSPAYGNTLAFERSETCEQLKKKLRPGDVIFSRTNNFLYQVSRRFMKMNYDHVAVIINNKEVIHISPPIISKIDMDYIMSPSREPLIIRPKVEDRQKFLNVVQNFLGEKYNLAAIPKFAMNQIKRRLDISTSNQYSFANLKYSRVCSDSILYSLCRGSQKIKAITQEHSQKGRFKEIGCFLPDEVAEILLANDSEIILKSKFQKQYQFINALSKGEEGIFSFIKNSKNMIKDKIDSFRKNNGVNAMKSKKQEKSNKNQGMLAFQVFSLVLALAQVLGASISNKIQYMMIIINTIMMVGHIDHIKNIVQKKIISPKL